MDKQPFDHIEDSFRRATEGISVPPNEAAWQKMNSLLDKEFDKKRRRRGIWWWFIMLGILVSVGGYLLMSTSRSRNTLTDDRITTPATESAESPRKNKGITGQPTAPATGIDTSEVSIERFPVPSDYKRSAQGVDKKKNTGHAKQQRYPDQEHLTSKENFKGRVSSSRPGPLNGNTSSVTTGDAKNQTVNRSDSSAQGFEPGTHTSSKPVTAAIGDSIISPNATGQADTIVKTGEDVVDSVELGESVPKKSSSSTASQKGFYMVFAAAADASGVKKINTKEFKPVFGGLVGYRINRRISFQTGFFAGKKVYTAGPNDYKLAPGSYVAKLISADAVCSIYELPLSVKLDLLPARKQSLFITSGLSTYILKKETYDMHFYNAMGNYRRMAYSYKNNTDYFSVLGISIGYERKIMPAFYLQAEPYLRVPVNGLGEGSVKLYSAGLQLGIKYQPIGKK